MFSDWPDAVSMRSWQSRAFNKFLASSGPDFLVVATPGAGKTNLALRVGSELLSLRCVSRMVVVVPTEHLKGQWADAASRIGIQLDPKFANQHGTHAADYDGVVLTFAQVASQPDVIRRLCEERPTFAVVDEIHHAGESRSWGDSLRRAIGPAKNRLLLSGTPFRTDGNQIPFVVYDENGQSRASFPYSYGDALSDGVCRPVLFPSYEGDMKWYSGGKKFEHTFRDELKEAERARRLRTALDPHGDWIRQVIGDADRKLTQVRLTHPDAGGLCFAMNREHANEIAPIFREITGESPVVVTCDDPDASRAIVAYASSTKRWIIAIKMISEGVDIPRLRVGIFATNTLTELFFRQAVGRFVRVMDGIEDQVAYFYIPREETLIGFAQKIKEERNHQLQLECRELTSKDIEGPPTEDKMLRLFLALSSTGVADDVVTEGSVISQAEIVEAESFRKELGFPANYDSALLAKLIRKVRGTPQVTVRAQAEVSTAPTEPTHVQKDRLKKVIRRLAATLVEASGGALDFRDVFGSLTDRDGVYQHNAEVVHLTDRIAHLEEWIRKYTDGD